MRAKNQNRFIERSIMGALSFLKESLFADEYASARGFLQARDPRAKMVMILSLLLTVLFSNSAQCIACVYGICLLLAFSSSIDVVFFVKRTWLFIPLFSLCIAIPALFNFFTPGEPLARFTLFTLTIIITRQGVASAVIFFLRVLASVSLCVLLSLTTRHNVLLKVLRIVGVPQVFVMTLGMCYRYVYLFIEIIQNTYSAMKSRVGIISSSVKGQRMVAWNIASLWHRSFAMHYQVYNAMLSRGFTGEPEVMSDFRMTAQDIAWLVASILLFVGSIWQASFLN